MFSTSTVRTQSLPLWAFICTILGPFEAHMDPYVWTEFIQCSDLDTPVGNKVASQQNNSLNTCLELS